MKTPDEIKKGLESCGADDCHGQHTDCPYQNDVFCTMHVCGQARVYIQQLESQISEPVRHGTWLHLVGMQPPEYHGKHRCSCCGKIAREWKGREELSKFCPNCGAKMDLEEI